MALFRVHALPRALPLVLAALACAAGGVSTGSGDGGLERVAVAPLNLTLGHVPHLAEAEGVVERELIRFLQERNIHVGLVHQGDAEGEATCASPPRTIARPSEPTPASLASENAFDSS